MMISEVMTRRVETVSPDTVLEEAANKMKELDVGVLPVFDGKLLMGMLTDRDIVIRSVAKGSDPRKTKVSDAMSPEVVSCYDYEELEAVTDRMKTKKIRRIPVVSREKELIGMVSLADVAERGDAKEAEETLEKVSEPAEPKRQ